MVSLKILALVVLEKKITMVFLLKKMMVINTKYPVLDVVSKTGLVTTGLV